MAKRMISMGSIEQFRTIVKNVQRQAQYTGAIDEDGNPILNKGAKAPTVIATASEKIHGTNASVCFSNSDGFWVQSRKNIITPEKDNAGCAFAQMANKDAWMEIINSLANEYEINLDRNIITIYFEWCGGNIQKNACVSGLDKMAIIFRHFKVSPIEPQTGDEQETAATWYETKYTTYIHSNEGEKHWVSNKEKNIYNVMDFPTVSLTIDFNRPDLAQNEMVKLTEEVEKHSGIAKTFDKPENIGEGWVWTFVDNRGNLNRWKTKGLLHSKGSGKVKTLKPVDSVLEQKKIDFVNEIACTEGRLNQMWTEIVHSVHNGDASLMEMKDIKKYLELVFRDVIKEESDLMVEQALEPKQINGMISKIAVSYFKSRLDSEMGI